MYMVGYVGMGEIPWGVVNVGMANPKQNVGMANLEQKIVFEKEFEGGFLPSPKENEF